MVARRIVALLLLTASTLARLDAQSPLTCATYDLDIHVEFGASRLLVRGTVTLPATASARDRLTLLLSSAMPQLRAQVVAPRYLAAARVTTDSAEGDRAWRISLPRPLPPGIPLVLAVEYAGDSLHASQLFVRGAGAFAGGSGEIWYPRLAFDSLAVGRFRYHTTAGHTVVATGELDADASDPSHGRFTFAVRSPSRVGFAAARYTKYSLRNPRPIDLYVQNPPRDAPALLRKTAAELKVLEETFDRGISSRSRNAFAVVEVDFPGAVAGLSEFGFLAVAPGYVDRGLPLPFVAHELAHRWWGTLIRTRPGPGRMFLTEGLASYGMLRAMELVEGATAAEAFRKSQYPGYPFANTPAEYFAYSAAGLESAIGTFVPRSGAEIMRMHRMANSRGWFLVHMLQSEIGAPAVERALLTLRDSGSRRPIDFVDFRRALEGATARDIHWFFEDWFMRTGAPEYALEWSASADVVRVAIRQPEPIFRATLTVLVRGVAGQEQIRRIFVDSTEVHAHWRIPFDVREVVLDPGFDVLRWTPELREQATRRIGLTLADFERRFGSASKALGLYRAALDATPVRDTTGLRYQLLYGLGLAALVTGDTLEGERALLAATDSAFAPPNDRPAALLTLARVNLARGDTSAARRQAKKALAADSVAGGTAGIWGELRRSPWYR